jgi:hypothetical protein
MADESADVKVRLVLSNKPDEMAKAMSDALAAGSVEASKHMNSKGEGMFSLNSNISAMGAKFKAFGAMGSAAMSAIGVAAGVAAGAGIAAITASMFAANSRLEKMKATTFEMIALSGKANMPLGDARTLANAYDAQFRRIAISAGATRDDVQAAFNAVAEGIRGTYRARLTRAQSEAITESMAQAAKVVPGGLSKLTAEYEGMKTGTFSSTGAIVGMVTATKVLKGESTEVARQMARMTDVQRMTVAEEGMRRMAKQAKDIPMGFDGLKNSLAEVYDLASTSIGQPIVNELLPVLTDVKNWFSHNATAIEITANRVGKYIGGFIQGVSKIVGTFYNVFAQDGGKVAGWIKDAFSYAEKAFSWIVENAEPLAKTFKDVFDVIISAIEGAAALLAKAAAASGKRVGGNKQEDADAEMARIIKEAQGGAYEAAFKRGGIHGKTGARETIAGADTWASQGMVDQFDTAVKKFHEMSEQVNKLTGSIGGEGGAQSVSQFMSLYEEAKAAHNEGMMNYMQSLVKGNATLAQSFIDKGGEVKTALETFAKDVGDSNFLDNVRKSIRGDGANKALAPQINFNGNTFNIKQDFRDQDPDRVMMVFERDIRRSSTNRVQSPYGMGSVGRS